MSKTNILLETGTNEFEVVEFNITYNQNKPNSANNVKKVQQSFGINVAKVREIIRMPKLTKMPNLPDVVYGIFRLRGDIYPAVDLSKFLYNQENTDNNVKMIIAEFNNLKVGFIVNEVKKIHRITWSQIVPADSMQEFSTDSTSIIGLFRIENNNVLMLDVEKIVADIAPTSAIDDIEEGFEAVANTPIAITAEDSAIIRKMITDKMNIAGFKLDPYNDGISCWERMQKIADEVEKGSTLSNFCNIVITDIEMPGMDGYTLTKNIKTHPILKELPVVLFSSIITPDLLHKGKSVGADAQMTKPQIGELLQVVRTLITDKSSVNRNPVM
ncbi:MAG: chemotaxis protein [Bacteroidetes bacterium]|nr:chemotaxis protein [Bacteroidota bacterium]